MDPWGSIQVCGKGTRGKMYLLLAVARALVPVFVYTSIVAISIRQFEIV